MLKPAVFLLCLVSFTAQAHEFWLAPDSYTPAEGDQVQIHWRVGEYFLGSELIYLPNRTHAMGVIVDGRRESYEPRFAAKPVFELAMPKANSVIVYTESSDYSLQYEAVEDFNEFIRLDRLTALITEASAMQTTPIKERYRRHAKTIVQGTAGVLTDQRVGMTYEWLIEWQQNGIRGVLFQGETLMQQRPVSLFWRDSLGGVEVFTAFTDANGEVAFSDLRPGEYLLNAIDMITPNNTADGAWYSHWVSTTFYVQP